MTAEKPPFWRLLEFNVLAAALVAGGGIWGFVELMEVARDSGPRGFDTRILLAFRAPGNTSDPIGPKWVEEAMRDLTALGSTAVLMLILLAVLLYLVLDGKRRTALFILLSVAGGQLLSSFLKLGIERPRPDLVSHLAVVYTPSFPSGHAMLSAVTYLTLGSLLAQRAPTQVLKVYVMTIAVIATLLVGVSRVYLGVHWPTDVLAGWCAGSAWAMLCWLAARALRRAGATASGS